MPTLAKYRPAEAEEEKDLHCVKVMVWRAIWFHWHQTTKKSNEWRTIEGSAIIV